MHKDDEIRLRHMPAREATIFVRDSTRHLKGQDPTIEDNASSSPDNSIKLLAITPEHTADPVQKWGFVVDAFGKFTLVLAANLQSFYVK